MGGFHETKVNDIRIHESGGEVHFHDDKLPLKVAVPVGAFKDKMVELDDPATNSVVFEDASQGTRATVEKCGQDVKVRIEKLSLLGKGLKALKDFASKV